ncbi:MAG: hypothetical protein ACE5DY_01425 [Mariprofundaceae bacterium]
MIFIRSTQIRVLALLIIYTGVFFLQESQQQHGQHHLGETLPARLQQAGLGYFQQLGAEMLYLKVMVFLGGRGQDEPVTSYAPTLDRHFQVISDLHPSFQDTYNICQSSLSWISPKFARRVNLVMKKGMEARPDLWMLPFFVGFNYFRYLDQPGEASKYLWKASKADEAPDWIGHLATVLAAEDGDIYGGMLWLKAMLVAEDNEMVSARYRADIVEFEKAIVVLQALSRYRKQYGRGPAALDDLQPEFLPDLPKMERGYELWYEASSLRLRRGQVH